MDEILIEEKKYVSSKQAAKITGYAKDYIGQLCREGRVPARLVGRSWYVLESAIQDHRFGDQVPNPKSIVKEKESVKQSISETWESPRYEATGSIDRSVPSVNRLGDEKEQEGADSSKDLHDSWKSWFAHFENTTLPVETASVPDVTTDFVVDSVEKVEEIKATEEEEAVGIVNVPIHIVSQKYPPKELMPRNVDDELPGKEQVEQEKEGKNILKATTITIQSIGVLVAISSVALALVGSGYFDNLLVSFNRGGYITGISVYIK